MATIPEGARFSWQVMPGRAAKLVQRLATTHRTAMRPQKPSPATWSNDGVTVTCLGHATVLIKLGGTTILTDPALLDRVGINVGGAVAGPRRITPPALTIDDLPPIDIVAISHAHPDHMDTGTLARLPWKTRTLVIPTGTNDVVAGLGFGDVREMAVGDTVVVAGVTITAVAVTHYGKRHAFDARPGRGYHGYLFEKDGQSVFFGGDTAHTVFPPTVAPSGVDVAVLGIGAYQPFVWNHANPEQAWDMAMQLQARFVVPMHWATFILSDEPVDEPLERLLRVAGNDVARVVCRSFGEAFTVPRRSPVP